MAHGEENARNCQGGQNLKTNLFHAKELFAGVQLNTTTWYCLQSLLPMRRGS